MDDVEIDWVLEATVTAEQIKQLVKQLGVDPEFAKMSGKSLEKKGATQGGYLGGGSFYYYYCSL